MSRAMHSAMPTRATSSPAPMQPMARVSAVVPASSEPAMHASPKPYMRTGVEQPARTIWHSSVHTRILRNV